MSRRKAWIIDEAADNMLSQMSMLTGKTRSALINDAIRQTYAKTSQLSPADIKSLERLAREILPLFFNDDHI